MYKNKQYKWKGEVESRYANGFGVAQCSSDPNITITGTFADDNLHGFCK